MKYIQTITMYLAEACDRNPIFTTIMIFLAMLAFNLFEASIERLVFGKHFEHWLDPLFTGVFIAWGAYATYLCAILRIRDKTGA